nr:putative pentatricopeptide repeat-containing protein At1g31840 [Malus domestica]
MALALEGKVDFVVLVCEKGGGSKYSLICVGKIRFPCLAEQAWSTSTRFTGFAYHSGAQLGVVASLVRLGGLVRFRAYVIPLTAVIEHYANAGRTNDAFKVFLYMLETGVNPNAYTYTVRFLDRRARPHSNDTDIVPNFTICPIRQVSLNPTDVGHITYIVTIKALTACSPSNLNFSFFVEFAKKYFVEMLDKGLQPTLGTYFALVERIDEGRDREEFVELVKAKGFMPTEVDFRQGKELEDETKDTSDKEMQQIFKKMLLLQMRSTSIRKDALRMYHGLVKEGQVDEAKEIFKQTKEKGILLDVAIHTVVIEAYANAGKAKGALKAYKHMLANGIKPNLYT